ncbi:hypothetical protein AVEN_26306-1 [Araneus ventricosus]|uniref:Uncharacterized protein n=1 Tax=Araneus ventricosus TaxID=182803 RepID=A0A4Y2AME1_ARAVE|nr:hypothetical protein AVEN_26306-1 [Araneus ventricosus]
MQADLVRAKFVGVKCPPAGVAWNLVEGGCQVSSSLSGHGSKLQGPKIAVVSVAGFRTGVRDDRLVPLDLGGFKIYSTYTAILIRRRMYGESLRNNFAPVASYCQKQALHIAS